MDIKEPSLEMIELKEDIGQLTEEMAFLTATIAAKMKQLAQIDLDVHHFEVRREKVYNQLQEDQEKLSKLLWGIK